MTDDNDVYTPAQYREHVDGHGHKDPLADPHTGHVRDPKLSRYLSVMRMHYDPTEAERPGEMPGQAQDLQEWNDVVGIETTDAGRKALQNGDMQTLKHQTGDQGQQADISGIKAMERIDDLVSGPAPVIIVLGEMGAGKTNFASFLGQRREAVVEGDHLVGTNIASLREKDPWMDEYGEPRDGFIPNYPTLKEWIQQDGDPLHNEQRPKTFIGDEFSVSAGGQGKQGFEVAQKMAPLVYLIRKYGGALIYIAHGEKSIHPLLWRVGIIVKKVSKKKALVAESIKNGELADLHDDPIEGIPETDWRYNDKEASEWAWERPTDDEDGPEMDEQTVKTVSMWTIRECIEYQDMSPRETAKFVPYSHTTVRNWFDEYQSGGEKAEWVSQVEGVIA
ncbi:hypothetical protein [Halosimplex halophilum]|uniref:hypothetical protein n=1 Tax=Halosimplex halophilum TaxID=2559572 RepID=UPI00107FD3CB|nr:hypothetical protein [Halosimplex halophilum]